MLKKEINNLKLKVKDYMKEYDVEFIKRYIKDNCKYEYERKLIGAKLLLNNSFIFDETWDMEQCRIPYVNKNLDWNFTPNGDEEWTFMLNRHEYLNKLVLAYYIEENDIYLDKLKELIINWIDNNPITLKGGKTIRTIDTGIRCFSWINMLIHLINEEKILDEEIEKIVFSIVEQLKYLKAAYIDKYVLSNWGVLQTTAIVGAHFWIGEFINDDELLKWAIEELYKQIDIQVLDDGSHWEQSVMYHVEVLNCSMKVINYSNYFDYKLKKEFLSKVESMAMYLMYCGDSNNIQEAQGDSDRTDIRDVLVKATILFENGMLKYRAYDNADLSSVFMFGKRKLKKYIDIEKREPKEKSQSFIDSGNIYVRSSFKGDSNFTYMQNGTLGSGHGHSDLAHISIHYKGKPFLIDSGRYTYVEEDFLREYLKSAKAHNVSVIDNSPFAVPKNSWGYEKYGDILKNYFIEKDGVSYAELPYLAELEDKTPYIAIKKVLILSKGIWVVVNDIRCEGKHTCTNYYNLDNKVKVIDKGDCYRCVNDNAEIDIYNYNVNKKVLKNSIISKNYNEINNSNKIETYTKFENCLINYDIIIGKDLKGIEISKPSIIQYNSNEEILDNIAITKEFKLSEKESYIVIIFNRETYKGGKVYFYNDVAIYGKVVVIHKIKSKYTVIRLKT
ncbi:Uncharacterized protein conserved in bacteria [uncultured Clostridium sp.]|uniref:heparinase II/III family protein n=1 Tax=uncultured Clostridium sp. TaxID=59620 RepID=UPI00082224A4|nr:heparinase II/III family protein [uncultured Clostridium sp.]SCJ07561.1 Uncharacterized protein conserved in bacteria [uncultured Clostridium sp.]